MRLFVIARHAQSSINAERRVSGDPAREVGLTELGNEEARALGLQIAQIPLEACVHTRFPRTSRTAEIALAGRDVPFAVEPLFDDLDVGELEGASLDDYRAWKERHPRSEPFPGGESLDVAARRYARGYRRLLESAHASVLLVCHEIPIRYALNAAAGSASLDGPAHAVPNATPFLFDEDALERAVAGIERLAGG